MSGLGPLLLLVAYWHKCFCWRMLWACAVFGTLLQSIFMPTVIVATIGLPGALLAAAWAVLVVPKKATETISTLSRKNTTAIP
jgi:hypothetical protein